MWRPRFRPGRIFQELCIPDVLNCPFHYFSSLAAQSEVHTRVEEAINTLLAGTPVDTNDLKTQVFSRVAWAVKYESMAKHFASFYSYPSKSWDAAIVVQRHGLTLFVLENT